MFIDVDRVSFQLLGVGSIPWSPLARGLLSRPFDAQKETQRSKTDVYALSTLLFTTY
jgi:aryl-alcohol dehydrogenase-like predicted oxidoreductase